MTAEQQTTGTPPTVAESDARRDESIQALAKSLKDTAKKYGADAVALQAALLMTSLKAGAAGPTEVSVVGVSPDAGADYLRIEVRTGIVFDADTTTPEGRGQSVWQRVALPALGRLRSVNFQPEGLDLLLVYGTQSFAQNVPRTVDLDKETAPVRVRVAIPGEALRALLDEEIAGEELLGRSLFVTEH